MPHEPVDIEAVRKLRDIIVFTDDELLKRGHEMYPFFSLMADEIERLRIDRDQWKATWKKALDDIANVKAGAAEAIADEVIAILTRWEEEKPPIGHLVVVWPMDQEGIVPCIKSHLEAAIQIRTADNERELKRLRGLLERVEDAFEGRPHSDQCGCDQCEVYVEVCRVNKEKT